MSPAHPWQRATHRAPQIPLSDIFKLNVGDMKSVDDYMKVGWCCRAAELVLCIICCAKHDSAGLLLLPTQSERCALLPVSSIAGVQAAGSWKLGRCSTPRLTQVLSKKGRWNYKDRQKK